MKVNMIRLIMKDKGLARYCAERRLSNPEDLGIQTQEDVDAYQGATFVDFGEGETCEDLHLVIRDGVYMVNFIEDGERHNYVYPMTEYGRVYYTQSI